MTVTEIEGEVKVEKTYYMSGELMCEIHMKGSDLYREDGPAIVEYFPNGNIRKVIYYDDGVIHHPTKPAYTTYNPVGEVTDERYCYNGIWIDDDVFLWCLSNDIEPTNNINNIPDDLKFVYSLCFKPFDVLTKAVSDVTVEA